MADGRSSPRRDLIRTAEALAVILVAVVVFAVIDLSDAEVSFRGGALYHLSEDPRGFWMSAFLKYGMTFVMLAPFAGVFLLGGLVQPKEDKS